MQKKKRILGLCLMVLLVAPSAWAFRVLEPIESAYELVLGEVGLPGRVPGALVFKPCDDCISTSLRLTGSTAFFVGRQQVSYTGFRLAAEEARRRAGGNQNTGVFAFYLEGTGQVTRLILQSYEAR